MGGLVGALQMLAVLRSVLGIVLELEMVGGLGGGGGGGSERAVR